jgi:O-antigen ligase
MPECGFFKILKEEKAYTAFSSALLLYTAFSSLSNYSFSAFGIKLYCAALLLVSGLFLYKFNPDVKFRWDKKAYLALALSGAFTLYFGLSILYSMNRWFGLLKWLNFILSFFPLIAGYYIFLRTITQKRFIRLAILTLVVLVCSAFVLIFIQPFNYGGTHWLSLTSWSHVVYGRIIGLCLIVMLILYKIDGLPIKPYQAVLVFGFLVYLIERTGYRSGLVALVVTVPIIVLYYIPEKQFGKKLLILIIAASLTAPLIYFHATKNAAPQKRVASLMHYSYGKMSEDEPLQTRYKLNNLCRHFIQEHPVTGIGWGGFRNQVLDPDPMILKYPHNILLEFWVELGMPGLLIFLIFLIWSFKRLWKVHPLIAFSYLYPLTVALFSKDIPDQTLFTIFFAILMLPDDLLDEWRQKFITRRVESERKNTV